MSATQTADLTGEQQRTLRILDFDPALPCESKDALDRPVCGERAAWVIRCKHCSSSVLLCHGHKREVIETAVKAAMVGCPACRLWRKRLDDLVDILPIGSAL